MIRLLLLALLPLVQDPAPLRDRMQAFVDRQEAAGIVAVVGRAGRAETAAVGLADREKAVPMADDTIFRIASMTKPVTAIALLMLEDEGRLSVDDPVEKHLPEFKGQLLVKSKSPEQTVLVKPSRPITIRDLATHTSGLPGAPPPGLSDLYRLRHRTLAEAVAAFSQMPLSFEPGTKWAYCNTGIDTLGRVVEAVAGTSFESFLEERLFKPLGMKDTFFYPTADREPRIAALYGRKEEALQRIESFIGDVRDGRYPLPAGGLYSTAPDLGRLCRLMLDRGVWEGRRLLSEAAVAKMTSNQTGELKAGFTPGVGMGLGWQVVREPQGVTAHLSAGTYGHGGAFGTQYWIDPVRKEYAILLVQRSGFPNGDASPLRAALHEAAAAGARSR